MENFPAFKILLDLLTTIRPCTVCFVLNTWIPLSSHYNSSNKECQKKKKKFPSRFSLKTFSFQLLELKSARHRGVTRKFLCSVEVIKSHQQPYDQLSLLLEDLMCFLSRMFPSCPKSTCLEPMGM